MKLDKTIDEYRPDGARNFIRLNDWVRVGPSRPNKRDGFTGRVTRIRVDDTGTVVGVDVSMLRTYNGERRHKRAGTGRVVTPDRVERVDQARMTRLLEADHERT